MMIGGKSSLEEFTVFLQKVQLLDLSPIAYQLMESKSGPQWTRSQTVQVIAHYLAFLCLIDRYPHLQLTPTREIDEVWHHHILDTSKYANDCQLLFGRFIHHFPYFGTRGQADQRRLYQAYALTQVLFHQHFGIHLVTNQTKLPSDCEPLLAPQDFTGCTQLNQLRPVTDVTVSDAIQILFRGWR